MSMKWWVILLEIAQGGGYWRAGWLSSDEIRDLSQACDQLVSPSSMAALLWHTRYKNILNSEWTQICSREEEGEGGRRSSEVKQEATLILKLLHLSASPAVTPDVQEPSAPVVLSLVETSGAIRIQLTKTPGTGCWSWAVMSGRGHLQDFLFVCLFVSFLLLATCWDLTFKGAVQNFFRGKHKS